MSRVAVYKRVSTDGQDLAMQDHALQQWFAEHPEYTDIRIFADHGYSGASLTRPAFLELCAAVDAGEIDTVVVYRLDRLSRSAVDALKLLITWIQRDIEFIAVDQPILQLDKKNPFRLSFLAIFSELAQVERDIIVSRINAGLAAAKARGVKLGRRPGIPLDELQHAIEMRKSGATFREIADRYKCSKAAVFNTLKSFF